LLPNGDVLFAGGVSCPDVDSKCRQAEVFSANHPEVDESVGVMGSDRFGHTATLLGDGRVLLAGGSETEAGPALNTAEVYDPVSMQFTGTKGPMRSARKGHSATLLANGRVLLAGGTEGDYAEIYDPATRTFAKVKVDEHPMASAPSRAVMLPSGKVLLSAVHEGAEENKNAVEVALYDPLTDRFSKLAAPKMMILAGHSETLLPDGRVLFSGYRASGPSTWTWRDVADDNGDKLNITEIGRHSSWRIHGKLAGFSEGSSGTTNASATNLPTAVWMRIPDGVPLAGGLSDLSFGAADKMQPDEADYQPPVTLLRGPGLLFIQAGASRSPGQFLTFDGKVNGGGCTQDAECESGACADGYCCDTRCDGECQSCGLENYHGICSSIDPDHDQDDASCKHGRCETNADCGTQEVCGPPDPSTHRRTCENPISPAEGCSLVISGSDVPSRRPLLLSIFLLSLVARRVRGRRGTVARARR
jgi:hypothetical protein